MDDILTIDTRTEDISGARIFMAQQLKRGDEVLVEARVEAAIIGENGRPSASRRNGWRRSCLLDISLHIEGGRRLPPLPAGRRCARQCAAPYVLTHP